MSEKIVAVDFDGTIVTHEFPRIGILIPNAKETLQRLHAAGVKIILWTMRSGDYLAEAIAFIETEIGVPLWGINENPTQNTWSLSPKAYAQIYIDDAALGCPLLRAEEVVRPFVDWYAVEFLLMKQGFLPEKSIQT